MPLSVGFLCRKLFGASSSSSSSKRAAPMSSRSGVTTPWGTWKRGEWTVSHESLVCIFATNSANLFVLSSEQMECINPLPIPCLCFCFCLVPTFVAFLRDVESPYEVMRHVMYSKGKVCCCSCWREGFDIRRSLPSLDCIFNNSFHFYIRFTTTWSLTWEIRMKPKNSLENL